MPGFLFLYVTMSGVGEPFLCIHFQKVCQNSLTKLNGGEILATTQSINAFNNTWYKLPGESVTCTGYKLPIRLAFAKRMGNLYPLLFSAELLVETSLSIISQTNTLRPTRSFSTIHYVSKLELTCFKELLFFSCLLNGYR